MTKLLTVLERYYENGWLDYACDLKHTALARCSFGLLLARDFYLAGLSAVKATDCSKIRVDGCGGDWRSGDGAYFHRQRYNAAMQAVPKEFWDVVRLVCIDDVPIAANDNAVSARRKAELAFAAKYDLCRGLDRLVDFYTSYKHPDDDC